jgi:hypothetical protein
MWSIFGVNRMSGFGCRYLNVPGVIGAILAQLHPELRALERIENSVNRVGV